MDKCQQCGDIINDQQFVFFLDVLSEQALDRWRPGCNRPAIHARCKFDHEKAGGGYRQAGIIRDKNERR